MEHMTEFSDQILPQATQAFTLIQHQLRELTDYCKQQKGSVSPDCFLEMENSLQKILHETRAACSPPPKKLVKSDFNIVRSMASAGGDCKSLVKKRSRFSVEASRFYIAELVLALEYIHSFGVIHRDLRPNNLLITATGHLRVADFGNSKVGSVNMAPCLTEEDCERVAREFTDEECYGTPLFAAPEVLQCEAYGKPIDWWSTGVILYNVLTGSMPFSDDTVTWTNGLACEWLVEYMENVINGDIHWPGGADLLPDGARDLISRLLEKDPVKRLGTRGSFEVKDHPFFQGVDWTNLPNQTAPYDPKMEEEEETSCFPVSEPDQDGVVDVQSELELSWECSEEKKEQDIEEQDESFVEEEQQKEVWDERVLEDFNNDQPAWYTMNPELMKNQVRKLFDQLYKCLFCCGTYQQPFTP